MNGVNDFTLNVVRLAFSAKANIVNTGSNWSSVSPGGLLVYRAIKAENMVKALFSTVALGLLNALVANRFLKKQNIEVSAKLAFNVFSIVGLGFSGVSEEKKRNKAIALVGAIATGAMYYFNPRSYSSVKILASVVLGTVSGVALNYVNPQ